MPIPSYRFPSLIQPQTGGTFPPASDPVLKQFLDAQRWYERLGVPFQGGGLLDRFPHRVPTEMLPSQGLLQPVIWDRVRRGLLGREVGTEGVMGMRGGGGGGRTTSVPSAGRRPPFVDWAYSENTGTYSTTTPAGVFVTGRPLYSRGGREGVDIEFNMPRQTFSGSKGQYAKGPEGMSTKRAISHIGEAFRAVKEFAQRFNPAEISFSGASRAHTKAYERLAPDLAEALGGKLKVTGTGDIKKFYIDIPEKVK